MFSMMGLSGSAYGVGQVGDMNLLAEVFNQGKEGLHYTPSRRRMRTTTGRFEARTANMT